VPDCQAKAPKKIGVHGEARIRCEGAQKYMKLFVAHKMTQNNTLNKVRVSATELSQMLSQNTSMFGEATAQSRRQTLCSSKVN